MGVGVAALLGVLDRVNLALYASRRLRKQPGTDDKVLAGWNGLMIAGFAETGRVLGDVLFLESAGRAAAFVLGEMRDPADGGLLRSWRNGEAKIGGFLEDYAFVAAGMLCAMQRMIVRLNRAVWLMRCLSLLRGWWSGRWSCLGMFMVRCLMFVVGVLICLFGRGLRMTGRRLQGLGCLRMRCLILRTWLVVRGVRGGRSGLVLCCVGWAGLWGGRRLGRAFRLARGSG